MNCFGFFLITFTVLLNVSGSIIMKEISQHSGTDFYIVFIAILLVIVINLIRMGLWNIIHRKFDLSYSYPLTSLFFPLVLVVGYFYGDVITWNMVVGAVIITLGVSVISYRRL